MANQHNDEQKLNISMSDLQNMLAALVAEMKKPAAKDPDLVARNEAARKRIHEQRIESEAELKQTQDNCSHLRDDGTSRIAWHEQYIRDKKLFFQIGFCQNCNRPFYPDRNDPEYIRMLKVPTGKPGLIMG
jgi:hypothetical protein